MCPSFRFTAAVLRNSGFHPRGADRIALEDVTEARQEYEDDTAILVTEMRGPSGTIRLTDALTLQSGADLTEDVSAARQQLLRKVTVLNGSIRLAVDIEPFGGAEAETRGDGLQIYCLRRPELDLEFRLTAPIGGLRTTTPLAAGDTAYFLLRVERGTSPPSFTGAGRNSSRPRGRAGADGSSASAMKVPNGRWFSDPRSR